MFVVSVACVHNNTYVALQSQMQSSQGLKVADGEFWCPLCRQLSNTVLPILPDEICCETLWSGQQIDLVPEVAELLRKPASVAVSCFLYGVILSMDNQYGSNNGMLYNGHSLFIGDRTSHGNISVNIGWKGGVHGLGGRSSWSRFNLNFVVACRHHVFCL